MTAREGVEVILAVTMLITPIAFLIHRSMARKKDGSHFGMGVRAVQFVGVSAFFPALIILALERLIDASTVAALGGAALGYLFSGLAEFDRNKKDSDDSSD